LSKGVLVISVDHSTWLDQLVRYYKPMIIQKVQERVGKKAVCKLHFRIG